MTAAHDAEPTHQCPNCRTWFTPRRSDQFFCKTSCNKEAADRELVRARRLYRALYHFRLWVSGKGRLNVAANFKFICGEVDSWIREDRASQRPPPPPHVHDLDRGHQRKPRPVRLVKPGRRIGA